MDKQEIRDLLIQVKVFYSRFDAVEKDGGRYMVMTQTVDSWYRQLGYMPYEKAIEILDRYMRSEEGTKTPSVTMWLNGGRSARLAWHNATLDLRHGVIVWTPEGGETYERRIVKEDHGCYEDEDGYVWAFAGGER